MGVRKPPKPFDYIVSYSYHKYKISEDLVSLNDYIFYFERKSLGGSALVLCDSESFCAVVNNHYNRTPFLNRVSAKIVATDDPELNLKGVPLL